MYFLLCIKWLIRTYHESAHLSATEARRPPWVFMWRNNNNEKNKHFKANERLAIELERARARSHKSQEEIFDKLIITVAQAGMQEDRKDLGTCCTTHRTTTITYNLLRT